MLKYIIDAIDEVSDEFQSLYVEKDGKFVLDVTGVKPESEFETVLGALSKERKIAKTAQKSLKQFDGITIEDINNLNDQVNILNAKDTSDVDALLKARLAPFEREKQKITDERDGAVNELSTLKETLSNSNRDSKMFDLANGKIKPEFMKDVKLRAKYELKYNSDMEDFVTSDGMTSNDWFAQQVLETPSWELDSNGAQLKGGSTGKVANNTNPWVTGNLSEQGRILNQNPSLAQKYKAQAGQ